MENMPVMCSVCAGNGHVIKDRQGQNNYQNGCDAKLCCVRRKYTVNNVATI